MFHLSVARVCTEEMQYEIVRHRGVGLLIVMSLTDDSVVAKGVARCFRNISQCGTYHCFCFPCVSWSYVIRDVVDLSVYD